MFLGKEDLSKN